MKTANNEVKQQYISGYKALQAEWKKQDKELLLVSRLAYWTYWLSKLAEASTNPDEKRALFNLKRNGLILLAKSNYVQIRKYIPEFHKKSCYSHHLLMKKYKVNPHLFISRNREKLESCPKCSKGTEHYFSLYSVAVLNEKNDIEDKKPLFIMYSPYHIFKGQFPDLDSLKSVKKYYGKELCTVDVDEKAYELNVQAFNSEFVFKYFTKNYNDLSEHLNK